MTRDEWMTKHGLLAIPETMEGFFSDWPHAGIDLGDEHYVVFHGHGGTPTPDAITGGVVLHKARSTRAGSITGEWCVGGFSLDVPENPQQNGRWQLVSWEPFHIEPSLLCSCGDHGFIRNGAWVRA